MTRRQLTALLRAALFGEPPAPGLMSGCDWPLLFALAEEQTVSGLVLDGAGLLPPALRPSPHAMLKQASALLHIEAANRLVSKRLTEFHELLREDGFHPLFVKGQTVAADYPQPLHRQCGDIDVWIARRDEAERLPEYLRERFSATWMRGEKETMFAWRGVTIDLHTHIADMQHPPYQRRLEATLLTALATPATTRVAGCDIPVLPPTLAALHLVAHIATHLLNWGCGLRQFCDLAVFLRRHKAGINRRALCQALDESGLRRMAGSLGWVLHESLGIAAADIPFRIEEGGAEIIAADIWEGGNFGQNRQLYPAHYGYLRRKAVMLRKQWRQCRRYRPLLPREAEAHFLRRFQKAWRELRRGLP